MHRGWTYTEYIIRPFTLTDRHPAYRHFMQHVGKIRWRVLLLRKAGRRIPWEILINEPGLIGRIRTHSCTYSDQKPYDVAVLNVSDSPIAGGIELLEPQLLMLGDQALILRGYEQLKNDDGPFTVLQEWRCEPA